MVTPAYNFIPAFLDAGADWISIHLEASVHLHKDIALIKEQKRRAGIALNPATPILLMNDILRELDFVLVLSVNPGWGGQKFIESSYAKIHQLRNWIKGQNFKADIEVDGGVSLENMESLIQAGANVFVAGAAVYHDPKPHEVIARMKEIARKFDTP
jgi:ribulose-phosphate 3-epimerase